MNLKSLSFLIAGSLLFTSITAQSASVRINNEDRDNHVLTISCPDTGVESVTIRANEEADYRFHDADKKCRVTGGTVYFSKSSNYLADGQQWKFRNDTAFRR